MISSTLKGCMAKYFLFQQGGIIFCANTGLTHFEKHQHQLQVADVMSENYYGFQSNCIKCRWQSGTLMILMLRWVRWVRCHCYVIQEGFSDLLEIQLLSQNEVHFQLFSSTCHHVDYHDHVASWQWFLFNWMQMTCVRQTLLCWPLRGHCTTLGYINRGWLCHQSRHKHIL